MVGRDAHRPPQIYTGSLQKSLHPVAPFQRFLIHKTKKNEYDLGSRLARPGDKRKPYPLAATLSGIAEGAMSAFSNLFRKYPIPTAIVAEVCSASDSAALEVYKTARFAGFSQPVPFQRWIEIQNHTVDAYCALFKCIVQALTAHAEPVWDIGEICKDAAAVTAVTARNVWLDATSGFSFEDPFQEGPVKVYRESHPEADACLKPQVAMEGLLVRKLEGLRRIHLLNTLVRRQHATQADRRPTLMVAAMPLLSIKPRKEERGAVVTPILDQKGWSPEYWAKEAGSDTKTVYNYLNGRTKKLNVSTRQKLAAPLGLQPGDLPR